MIQVYRPGNEDFAKNGDAVLYCRSCVVEAELGGSWRLELDVPIDREGRWKFVTENAVIKAPTWQEDIQLYRISKIEKTEDGVSAIAYPIFYDSANDCFLMDCRPVGKSGQEALDMMTADSPYSGKSDIVTPATAYFVRRNLMSAINGTSEPTFIQRWGGEILYDNYTIIINKRVGGDYGVEARYGRNINGVTYIVDTNEVITRIIPIAYNGYMMSGDEPWVDSPNINAYPKIFVKEVHYDNIKVLGDARTDEDCIVCDGQAELDAALREAAEADFASGVDAPKVTLDIDMALIRSMRSVFQETLADENDNNILDSNGEDIFSIYSRDYRTFENVRLGDTIHCRHYKLDITSTARVIALTWDCIRECVFHVTLGDYQYDYVKSVSSVVNRVSTTIRSDGSLVAEKVRGFLDGAQTQLRTQYNLAEKQDVMAILFENLDTNSPMYGALGIGTQGICISKTRTEDGRDWDWTTGITANGINASVGVFGILADRSGRNYFNLDTGDYHLSSETLIGGKTINQYMDQAESALAEYATTVNSALQRIQDEIDGQYESYFENYSPTLSNYPANEWTTEALREQHEGDLFYNKATGASYRFFKNDTTGEWEWLLITDTVATQALQLAAQAKDTADGKRRVFVSTPVPPYDEGDIFFTGTEILVCVNPKTSGSYVSTDFARRDTYNTEASFNNFLDTYLSDIADLQSDIDDHIETWPQGTDPALNWSDDDKASHAGDIWYNTSVGTMSYWTGVNWETMTTTPPASVIASIDSKARVFISQPTPPYKVGDLWFNSATSDIMTCVISRNSGSFFATDWEKRNKYTDDSALEVYKLEMGTLTDDLQDQLDGKVETWYQSSDPSPSWADVREGVLQDLNAADILDENSQQITTIYDHGNYAHIGDLWHNTSNNTQWRWSGVSWEPVEIPDSVMDTIDGKKTIYNSQPRPPYQQCDLWVQGATGDILVCIMGREEGESFNISDWALASKYTDDSALLAWMQGEYADTIADLREQADQKAETWYQASDPSLDWDDYAVHRGDLWYKTTDHTTWYWTGLEWSQQNVPTAVFDKIDTKAQIFAAQPTIPYYENDLWYTGTVVKVCTQTRTSGTFKELDWVKRDFYTDDSSLTAFISNEFADLQASNRSKIETWSQSSDPSTAWTTPALRAEHEGDLWYNTSANSQKLFRWTGSSWAETKATPPQAVTDTIAGKANIFIGQSTPSAPKDGDLWLKSADDDILTYVNGAWVKYNKYTDDSFLTSWINGDYASTIAELRLQDDAKAETWVQADDPATEWIDAEKANHKGDIWLDTTAQIYKIYTGTEWQEMKTNPPSSVMNVISGKAQIFANEPYPPYNKNDIWFTGNEIRVCIAARTTGSYQPSDWIKKDYYTDDSSLTTWVAGEYADTIEDLETAIDGKIETWCQSSDPSISWAASDKAKHKGDLWQNTSTKNFYRYTGSGWETMASNPPQEVFDRIDSKAQVFATTPTTPYYKNDLWYTGAVVKVCVIDRPSGSFNESDWQKKDYYTDDSSLNEFLAGDFATVLGQVDRKIETWYQATDPSINWTGKSYNIPLLDSDGEEIADESSNIILIDVETEKMEHGGDLWTNVATGEQFRFDSDGWTLIPVPYSLMDTIDGKAAVFVGPDTPVDPQERDLWFVGPDEAIYTYINEEWIVYNKYTDDSALEAFITGPYASVIETLKEQDDQKAQTWMQTEDPSKDWDADERPIHEGDIWFDGQTYYIYTGSAWNEMKVTPPPGIMDVIDGKSSIFVGATEPADPQERDLWFKGPDEGIFTFVHDEWVEYNKYTDDENLYDFVQNTYEPKVTQLEGILDGKAETWYQASDPAIDWKDATTRALHKGDVWFNTGNQTYYIYSGAGWTEMKTEPPAAIMNTIDGKANIFLGSTTPSSAKEGDLWFKGTDEGIYTFVGGTWRNYNKYTDDSALTTFISGDYAETIQELRDQDDARAETWYQSADPSSSWTAADKPKHKGDIWFNTTSTVQKYYIYSGSAWTEMKTEPPKAIMDEIDGKAQIFASQPVPPYYKNDIWFTGTEIKVCTKTRESGSFSASEWAKKDYYTDDSALNAWIAGDYAETIQELKDQDDQKAETWYQAKDPSLNWADASTKALHKGDIWFNTSTSTYSIYTGTAWSEMKVEPPASIMNTITGKANIFVGSSTPSSPKSGDLWFKGTGEGIYTYVNGKWTEYNKYTDDSSLETFISGTYADALADLQDQIDDKIETWFFDHVPANDNLPASAWSTNAEKAKHVGDLFYDITLGSEATYRYTSAYKWVKIEDASIDQALRNAAEAQATADGKMTIYTTQPSVPYYVGDMWISNDEVKYCIRERLVGSYMASDWILTPTESKVQATIESLDGEIIAQVVAGNIINAINLSSEGIAIEASKLNINGVTSINNYFKVNVDGTFEGIKGKIGEIIVDTSSVHTVNHNAYASSNNGFYLGSDGKFSLGNGTTYLRYNGSGALDLRVSSLTIGGVTAATSHDIAAVTGIANKGIADAATAQSTADQAVTNASTAQSTANTAVTNAATAQTTANTAVSNAATAQATADQAVSDAAEAAKVATNFLYFDETNGLIVSEVGSVSGSTARPYSTQIKGDGIYFRTGTQALAKISGSAFTIYRPGSANVRSMELDANGLNFYKPTSTAGGEEIAAKYTSSGLEVISGKIAGFTIESNSMYIGTLGDGTAKSVYVSAGTTGRASIGGSNEISGWVFTSRNTFGVNVNGNVYVSAGKIGGLTITSGSIYSGSKSSYNSSQSGFYLGSAGTFGLGNSDSYIRYDAEGNLNIKATSVYIGASNIATAAEDAAKTATNYIYYDATNGVVISQSGTADGVSARPYNVQIKGNGIYLRNSSTVMASVTGSAFTIYRPGSDVAMMQLTSSGLNFYKLGSDTVAAKYTATGLEVSAGKIAGFTIEANSLYIGTLGASTESVFVSAGTPSSMGSVSIGGSGNLTGWILTSRNTFGVNKNGNVYMSAGKIGGLTITNGSIYSGSKSTYNSTRAGFYLGSGGEIGIGDGTNYIRWDGSSTLNIRASSVVIAGTDVGDKISTIEGNLSAMATDISNASTTAVSASEAAELAQTTATSAANTASSALTAANEAGKTATSFLHVTSSGLVVNNNQSSVSTGQNVIIASDGIGFRNGTIYMSEITKNAFIIYKPGNTYTRGTALVEINANGIYLKNPNGTNTVTITSAGLSIGSGSISGMTIYSNRLECTNSSTNSTLFLGNYSSTAMRLSVGYTKVFELTYAGKLTATDVDLTGKITASSGKISGWTIDATGLRSTYITLYPSAIGFGSNYSISSTGAAVLNTIQAAGTATFNGTVYMAGTVSFSSSTGTVTFNGSTVKFANLPTTEFYNVAYTLGVDSNGRLYKIS